MKLADYAGEPRPDDDDEAASRALLGFEADDGGRRAAGYVGSAGDCVVRAVAIAVDIPYRQVYDDLASRQEGVRRRRGAKPERRTARDGVLKKVYKPYLLELGWEWTPTMFIGSGCTVHLRADELPAGRLIVEVSKHVVAVIDRVMFDTHDPSRGGTRCVYGMWSPS